MAGVYDKEIKDTIKDLNDFCNDYLYCVNQINECAWTDRIIENILTLSKKLEDYYNNNFDKDDEMEV